jgi:hypothetical protein
MRFNLATMERERDGYLISTDPARLDREAIWRFLRTSYWSPNIPREVVERAIQNSLVFGLFAGGGDQAGFARVVTDKARFAWLTDVFVPSSIGGKVSAFGSWRLCSAIPRLPGFDSCSAPPMPTGCTSASAFVRSTPLA